MVARRTAALVVLLLTSCTYEPTHDLLCEPGAAEPDRVCHDGVWVAVELDAGDGTDEPDVAADVQVDLCEAEEDAELCTLAMAECGTLDTVDRCQNEREVDCGTCDPEDVCVDNVCECIPEEDTAFCERLNKDCGTVTDADNCGVERSVTCGTCSPGIVCGETEANVCGCPCLVDGTCIPEGQHNPDDPCEICDSAANPMGWSIDDGNDCDDGDLCTHTDTCQTDGSCAGMAVDCTGLDTDCEMGVCDPASGSCRSEDRPDDTTCTLDEYDCTLDVCRSGTCQHPIESGKCLIAGTCHDMGETNSQCEECDPSNNNKAWTILTGQTCMTDTLNCTTQTCGPTGTCVLEQIDDGTCLVSGTCYTDGEASSDPCQTCQSTVSKTTFSPNTGNTCDDGKTCTSGTTCVSGQCAAYSSIDSGWCFIGGRCLMDDAPHPAALTCAFCDASNDQEDWSAQPTTCLINNECYSDGQSSDLNTCQVCDASQDQYGFTTLSDGATCGSGCECVSGDCRKTSDGSPC